MVAKKELKQYSPKESIKESIKSTLWAVEFLY